MAEVKKENWFVRTWGHICRYFRELRSELKKVVWLPWNQTRKSSLVVLVVMLAFAVAIGLLDWGLGEGFLAFVDLF